ncbi:hypothetical protein D3C72_1263250 [compost metagenome]
MPWSTPPARGWTGRPARCRARARASWGPRVPIWSWSIRRCARRWAAAWRTSRRPTAASASSIPSWTACWWARPTSRWTIRIRQPPSPPRSTTCWTCWPRSFRGCALRAATWSTLTSACARWRIRMPTSPGRFPGITRSSSTRRTPRAMCRWCAWWGASGPPSARWPSWPPTRRWRCWEGRACGRRSRWPLAAARACPRTRRRWIA